MIKKRIKKNLGIVIHVRTNGEFISLEGRDIRVERVDPYGHRAFVEQVEMQDNRIAFTFRASEQNKLGVWKFIVWEGYGTPAQTLVDRERALQLVASTDLETPTTHEPGLDVERVDLKVVDIEVGVKGDTGDPGMSLYELMVPEGRFSGTLMEFLDAQEQAMKQAGVDATNEVVEQTRAATTELIEQTRRVTEGLAQSAATAIGEAKREVDKAGETLNEAAQRQPKIVDGFWYVWSFETGQYVNTGVKALGEGGGASVEVIDRLDSPSATAALSAKQGMLLKSLVDGKTSFSGNYNDLTNKPTIPAAVTEATVSGWGFTKNNGTYSKPSGGIPKTDLAESVQTSLGKADTALQTHQNISGKADKSYVDTELGKKQNTISDLDTIRSGASTGATAVQPSAISDMETKTHASQTYQPKGSYATSEQLQTVSEKVDLMYEDYTTALNLV